MKRITIFLLIYLTTLSCSCVNETKELRIPIIRYNPETYLSDIESAFANPASYECLSDDAEQIARLDKEIITYLNGQSAFIISLEDGDTEHALRFIGIKDEKQGYLKYLNVEKEHYRYSLDAVIEDIYGSLEEYAATWPEDQRHLFYDDPKGLYTFPNKSFAMNVVGYGNSKKKDNPVKFKAAISFLRTTSPKWSDDTWAADSVEIVKFSDSVTGINIEHVNDRARFEGKDANYFSKWVMARMTYPDAALDEAATGRVITQFTIDMFGNLEDVKVLRGRHPALDSIVFNVISSSPKWTPAQDFVGNPISVTYTFPVIFMPDIMFKAFIIKMYNKKLYEDYDFLQKHCSQELLKKLQDACPYDSDEPAYATWMFRSGRQDCKPDSDCETTLLDVKSEGEWYTYNALDMGWEFTRRIKLSTNENRIIIDDIGRY